MVQRRGIRLRSPRPAHPCGTIHPPSACGILRYLRCGSTAGAAAGMASTHSADRSRESVGSRCTARAPALRQHPAHSASMHAGNCTVDEFYEYAYASERHGGLPGGAFSPPPAPAGPAPAPAPLPPPCNGVPPGLPAAAPAATPAAAPATAPAAAPAAAPATAPAATTTPAGDTSTEAVPVNTAQRGAWQTRSPPRHPTLSSCSHQPMITDLMHGPHE